MSATFVPGKRGQPQCAIRIFGESQASSVRPLLFGEMVKAYIRNHEKEDERYDQMRLER